eukprot:Phypoly_transcript_14752.p1 GENE.Phypoly_transcript_14752~~Phypoly_transcript_14752.p1  ORF type:complete len:137 (-),score=19.76 Phypoly_transcript_14752:416-826(-)
MFMEEYTSNILYSTNSSKELLPFPIHAKLCYRKRSILSFCKYYEIELMPSVNSSGLIAYKTRIKFEIKRGAKLKLIAESALSAQGHVKELSTPYANLRKFSDKKNSIMVEHTGETVPWQLCWDPMDPYHILISPVA